MSYLKSPLVVYRRDHVLFNVPLVVNRKDHVLFKVIFSYL